jgi:outer membrane immunogenic protein
MGFANSSTHPTAEWDSSMKKLLLLAVSSLTMVAGASAADLPPAYPYSAAPAWSWTGFYIGGNGGYGFSTSRNQLALSTDQPTGLFSAGGFGGVQVGYNVQLSRVVLGLEADFQGASIGDGLTDLNFGDVFSSQLNSFGTVRGRLGYAFSPVLLYYLTGGFAYGHLSNLADIDTTYSFSGMVTGYTLGAGVEYAFTPAWSFKAEYLYLDFGKHDPTNAAGARFSQTQVGVPTVNNDAFNTVRVGVNYRFLP